MSNPEVKSSLHIIKAKVGSLKNNRLLLIWKIKSSMIYDYGGRFTC